MSALRNRFEMGRHETFALREGWLSKGMARMSDAGTFKGDIETADALGIGKNMAKSLSFWLEASGLAGRPEGDGVHALARTDLQDRVATCDPHFEYAISTWFTHMNVARRPSAVWNWFFNDFRSGAFDRETAVEGLMRHLKTHSSNPVSAGAAQREVGCLLLTYAALPPSEKVDPEDYTVSPLRSLGLVLKHADTGRFEKTTPLDDIPLEAFLACVSALCRDADTATLPLADLISRRNSPARLFNVDGDAIDELSRRAADAYGHLGVSISLLGATRTITVPDSRPEEWYSRHFERIAV